jgi:hypothetical protein
MTQNSSAYPRDLAAAVRAELSRRGKSPPQLDVLVELFESMYFASLKTEEAKPVAFHVVYVDPKNPDPKPPKRLVHDRWSCVKLGSPIPLSSGDFLKIARASDPRTSSFAVYHDGVSQLSVWGLIDQGNSYHDYINFQSESGPERPGLFQASILGTGHLAAYVGYEKIAELRQNSLVRIAIDVFREGRVREALEPGIQSYIQTLRKGWPDEFPEHDSEAGNEFTQAWLTTLRRLLLRTQGIRHGGAFLLTDEEPPPGLSVKHRINYNRLRSALQRYAVASAQQSMASGIIGEEYLDADLEEMPVGLHLDEVIAGYDLEEIRTELDGAIWFISLLTRVDGLVLMNKNLEIRGFGVEITVPDEPSMVFVSNDSAASEPALSNVDYLRYGTRHRSMMRYCAKHAGSVGFVVSQDGDVRAVTKVTDRLVLWDNIQLQLPGFVPRRKRQSGTRATGQSSLAGGAV